MGLVLAGKMPFSAMASEGRTWYLPSFGEFTQPTFRDDPSVPNSRVKKCKIPSWISWPLKTVPICRPETSARIYQPTLRKFPKRTQVSFTWQRNSRITPTEHVAVRERGLENSVRVCHHTCIHVSKIPSKISMGKKIAFKPTLTHLRDFEDFGCSGKTFDWKCAVEDNGRDAVLSGII